MEHLQKTLKLENGKREIPAALQEARAVKVQADKDLNNVKEAEAKERVVYKFGLERFSTNSDYEIFYKIRVP